MSRPRDATPVTGVVVLLVALVAAAWSGLSWYGAAHDGGLRYSHLREEVLRSGEQAVQNLNSLDYRHVDQGLKLWQDSTTSDLRQQIVQGRDTFVQQVQASRTVSTARILEAALTELDDRAGRARIIVALQITVVPPTGQPATKQSRLVGQLTRTGSGWKLDALGQAPVGTSGS